MSDEDIFGPNLVSLKAKTTMRALPSEMLTWVVIPPKNRIDTQILTCN